MGIKCTVTEIATVPDPPAAANRQSRLAPPSLSLPREGGRERGGTRLPLSPSPKMVGTQRRPPSLFSLPLDGGGLGRG